MLAFIESATILATLAVFAACVFVVVFAIYRILRSGKVSRGFGVIAVIAAAILLAKILPSIIMGEIEYNPMIDSSKEVVGTYSNGERSLTLNADGTYTAKGFSEMSSGLWSSDDWNLQLSNSSLERPRIVTRGKTYFILPYYSGPDGSDGIVLRREAESEAR